MRNFGFQTLSKQTSQHRIEDINYKTIDEECLESPPSFINIGAPSDNYARHL